MKKKLLSLLIVFAMALSMVPMVSADGGDSADNYGLIPGTEVGAPTGGTVYTAENATDDSWKPAPPAEGEDPVAGTITTIEQLANFLASSEAVTPAPVITGTFDLAGATLTVASNKTFDETSDATFKNGTFEAETSSFLCLGTSSFDQCTFKETWIKGVTSIDASNCSFTVLTSRGTVFSTAGESTALTAVNCFVEQSPYTTYLLSPSYSTAHVSHCTLLGSCARVLSRAAGTGWVVDKCLFISTQKAGAVCEKTPAAGSFDIDATIDALLFSSAQDTQNVAKPAVYGLRVASSVNVIAVSSPLLTCDYYGNISSVDTETEETPAANVCYSFSNSTSAARDTMTMTSLPSVTFNSADGGVRVSSADDTAVEHSVTFATLGADTPTTATSTGSLIFTTRSEVTLRPCDGGIELESTAAEIEGIDTRRPLPRIGLTGKWRVAQGGNTATYTPVEDQAWNWNGQEYMAEGDLPLRSTTGSGVVSSNYGTPVQIDYSPSGYFIDYSDVPASAYGIETLPLYNVTPAQKEAEIEGMDDGWSPAASTFFEISAADGSATEPGVTATVHVPFADPDLLPEYAVGHWTGEGYDVLDASVDSENEGYIKFDTDTFSPFVLASPQPYYYLTIADGPVDQLDEAAETAAGIEKHKDDSDNDVYDLESGDTFTVELRSSMDFLNGFAYLEFDSTFLELTDVEDSRTADGIQLMDVTGSGSKQFYALKFLAPMDGSQYEKGSVLATMTFELKLPLDTSELQFPLEVPIQLSTDLGAGLQATSEDGAESGHIKMGARNTLVRVNGTSGALIEVVPLGENTALILAYTKNPGVVTYTDDKVIAAGSAQLMDVTDAGYIYRFDKANEDQIGDQTTAAAFYSSVVNPYVYGIAVDMQRLQTASNKNVITDQSAVEQYVLGKVSFAFGEVAKQVGYTGGMDVNADGGVNSDDEAWVLAVASGEGTTIAAASSATGWAKFYNNMLALNNAAALRTDFVRTPQTTDDENKAKTVTADDEVAPIAKIYLKNVAQ